ncbi:peptidase M29 [Clostridium sp. MF28]|uniref:Aminopeptidase n=1 Tax=Clostridium diolis TaxID=223919 RepID=A0AAV3W6A8_9CLOT|nr:MULTISPECIES: aminopeptidase [Clostridium]ALB47881.1 aminopeptidase [Clostridium beijerinckii NRRL B-598]AVK49852.1 peptidase M29 [Clostridium sp. MF28]PSM59630.1 aminopeptidase [Clostridium diolis]QES72079.1 aminopeptidase [Clostridium diolis]GEA32514.1 aminopeptidase [Clostridium diolis]
MLDNLLSKYAKLAIIKGVNIQKDGLLVINSPIECSNFARLLADEAYKSGASDVVINYNDEKFNKIRFNNSAKEILSITPKFEKDKYDYYVENNAAFLSISASDPDIFKDVDSEKISAYQKGRRTALEKYHSACTSNKNAWCIVSIPTENWAKKVFSESNSCEAIEKLWDAIFTVMRLKEQNPIDAWNKHTNLLHDKVLELNSYKFKYLHFTNSLGTDLKIGLVQDHIWCGGEDITQDGLRFIANMPTEEVYTTPKLDDVNGIVFSSKPLSYCGNLINNFSLTFKNGKVVACSAETGLDILTELLNTDEGSRYLGEVALVPYNSPISNSNIIFYNTLYDENASCHLALGSSYPCCIKNGEKMTREESILSGSNVSLIHVDFMIGTKDTNITGITPAGEEIKIFNNGNWF